MHQNKINGKVYIGETYQNPPENRWKKKGSYRGNIFLTRAIEKYGWENFSHTILEEGFFTEKEMSDKENYWINKFDSRNPDKGYNINPGGYKGLSPKAAKAAVDWMKEHPEFGAARVADMHKWQNEHPEEMLKMRRINSQKATEARKRKVQCVETGVIYESASAAARIIPKTSQSKICLACSGKRNTSGGYHWRYIDE